MKFDKNMYLLYIQVCISQQKCKILPTWEGAHFASLGVPGTLNDFKLNLSKNRENGVSNTEVQTRSKQKPPYK